MLSFSHANTCDAPTERPARRRLLWQHQVQPEVPALLSKSKLLLALSRHFCRRALVYVTAGKFSRRKNYKTGRIRWVAVFFQNLPVKRCQTHHPCTAGLHWEAFSSTAWLRWVLKGHRCSSARPGSLRTSEGPTFGACRGSWRMRPGPFSIAAFGIWRPPWGQQPQG